MVGKAKTAGALLKHGSVAGMRVALADAWHAQSRRIGLERDLAAPFTAPDAHIPIRIRPFAPCDLERLLDRTHASSSPEERSVQAYQRRLIDSEIPTCFVAANAGDEPCYMQWLILARDVPKFGVFRGGFYPDLKPDEALLDGAYTPAHSRGHGIMPAAMAAIAETGGELGVRRVITFVQDGNLAALKGCERAGFDPFIVWVNRSRYFRRSHWTTDLPAASPAE